MKAYLTVTIKGWPARRNSCMEYSETYRLKVHNQDAMMKKELNRAFERYCWIKEIKFEVERRDSPDTEPKTEEAEIVEELVEDLKV